MIIFPLVKKSDSSVVDGQRAEHHYVAVAVYRRAEPVEECSAAGLCVHTWVDGSAREPLSTDGLVCVLLCQCVGVCTWAVQFGDKPYQIWQNRAASRQYNSDTVVLSRFVQLFLLLQCDLHSDAAVHTHLNRWPTQTAHSPSETAHHQVGWRPVHRSLGHRPHFQTLAWRAREVWLPTAPKGYRPLCTDVCFPVRYLHSSLPRIGTIFCLSPVSLKELPPSIVSACGVSRR